MGQEPTIDRSNVKICLFGIGNEVFEDLIEIDFPLKAIRFLSQIQTVTADMSVSLSITEKNQVRVYLGKFLDKLDNGKSYLSVKIMEIIGHEFN